jgi:serine/threonine protein kinase
MTTIILKKSKTPKAGTNEVKGYFVDAPKAQTSSYEVPQETISGHGTNDFHVVLIDFGMVAPSTQHSKSGTPWFMPYEKLLNSVKYNAYDCKKADVYALYVFSS